MSEKLGRVSRLEVFLEALRNRIRSRPSRLPYVDNVDLLGRVPLFEGFSRHSLRRIVRHADIVNLRAGKVLARRGELGLEFVILLAGRAWLEGPGGTRRSLSVGDCFGGKACLDGKPRGTTVVADTDVALAVFPVRAFSYLLDMVPELSRQMLLHLCERLDQAERDEGVDRHLPARPGTLPQTTTR